jgi:DNA-binding NtrC family response regulator
MSTRSRSIIAVDENVRLLDQIATMLDGSHRVLATSDPNRAVSWLKTDLSVCAVIAAESLRAPTGMEILSLARELRPEARRILITNYSDLSSIMGKVHSGVVQRTISPPIEPETLIKVIGTAPAHSIPHQPGAEAAA